MSWYLLLCAKYSSMSFSAKDQFFSLLSQLWTCSTRSWWMIMSLWRDTWVTVDNHRLGSFLGRGTEVSTHPPQAPVAGSPACHKYPVWLWTTHPASQHLVNPSFSPFLVLLILSICTLHCILYTGRRPRAIRPCSWVEIIHTAQQKRSCREVRDFRRTFLFSSSNCCPWFASLIMVQRKKEETTLTLMTGLKHGTHYQYFFCLVFTLFKCTDFWFLLCRKLFRVVTFGFSLANGCEKSTFFIWTCSFTVKKSVGSGRSSKARFLFQPVTRNRWARSRHTHFRNMKDVGEIFQTATQAGSVPTSHNCHRFPVRCFGKLHRALICIFKSLHVFDYLVHSDQKQPVRSLPTVTTSLISYIR